MKKQFITEAQRLQKLAGITEARIVSKNNLSSKLDHLKSEGYSPNDIKFLVDIINEAKQNYSDVANSGEILYKGLNKILTDPFVDDEIVESISNHSEDQSEPDIDQLGFITSIVSDIEIMRNFAPQLVQNLLDAGFTYDSNEDAWTVPDKYYNDSIKKYLPDQLATSYGIIWFIWGVDYDTDERERIGEILEDAAVESLSTNEAQIIPKRNFLSSKELYKILEDYWDNVDSQWFIDMGIDSKDEIKDYFPGDLVVSELVWLDLEKPLDDFYKKYKKILVDGNDYTDTYFRAKKEVEKI